MSLTCKNLKQFSVSLRAVKLATRKDGVEIVNRALRDVAYRAAQFSPKTTAAAIDAELRSDNLLPRIASAQLKREKGKFTAQERTERMRQIRKKRRSGAGALRASWAMAIMGLGGTFRGAKVDGRSASQGFGKKATISHLVARIRSAVVTTNWLGRPRDASQIAPLVRALSLAVEFVTRDREAYAQRKIEATLRKHSDH